MPRRACRPLPRALRGAHAFGLLVIASFARADAPTNQYALFDTNDLVIQDNRSALTWQRHIAAQLFTFDEATTYCATLSLAGSTKPWRVPSYKELLTIVDESPHIEYEGGGIVWKAIDKNAFWGTPLNGGYWTSSPAPAAPGKAFAVSFDSGEGGVENVTTHLNVRCVLDP